VRIGAPALTTRGFKEADFEKVADFLDRAVKIALNIQVQHATIHNARLWVGKKSLSGSVGERGVALV
jgi:glycine/serine hydroxymethyltransferase